MEIKVAIAHMVDSRGDYYITRQNLVIEELRQLDWMRSEFTCIESEPINNERSLLNFAKVVRQSSADVLIVHIPIWADPIFTFKLTRILSLPTIIIGNNRPETSSMVGILGAGGALDQIGYRHVRIFDIRAPEGQTKTRAYIRAAGAVSNLKGQTLGLFGGRSLGIITAVADPAQWQLLFGVDIEFVDQLEIKELAESLPDEMVEIQVKWLISHVHSVKYGGNTSSDSFVKQVRSFLATRQLANQKGFDFVGVKCQPEMSDGYVTQCVAHMLMNSGLDAAGGFQPIIHACESDADGALTMQIMNLLNRGKPAALLDIRWFDPDSATWTLANCGAVPAPLCGTARYPNGLGNIRIEPHVFGAGGGAALPAQITPQKVTLARLCRRSGEYWMTIIPAEVVEPNNITAQKITPAFPRAYVKMFSGPEFLQEYCSNHIHMTTGDICQELIAFCELVGIEWKMWD